MFRSIVLRSFWLDGEMKVMIFVSVSKMLTSPRHVQNQIFIGGYWYVIYTRSWFRSCMGLRLRSRLGNFGKISRDFGKYSSRPGFSVYNLGKITEIWSRLIFFVYCSLNLNTVIVLLPRKRQEKLPRSRSRSRSMSPRWTGLLWTSIMSVAWVMMWWMS